MRALTQLALICLCLSACAEGDFDETSYTVDRSDAPIGEAHDHEHAAAADSQG